MSTRPATPAARLIRHRRLVIGAWVLLALAIAPGAARVKDKLSVAATVPGSESAHVEELITTRFRSGFAQYAVLVITGAPSPRSDEGRNVLVGLRDSLLAQPFVSRTFSFLDGGDSLFVGPEGETFMVIGLNPGGGRADALVPQLRHVTAGIAFLAPNAIFRWTGEIALNHDLRSASSEDAASAERRAMPVTLILLVVAFGTLAAALLPLFAGGLAIALALGLSVAISGIWPLSVLLQNVVTMLGLGLGIDYALLVVGRFREGLGEGLSPTEAAAGAASRAGHTILLSGISVAIGFAALVFVPVNEIRSIAVGGLLVVVMAVLVSSTLLPSVLAMIGERVNWGTVRRSRTGGGSESWRKWGRMVCAQPLAVLIVAGAPVAALAFQATRLSSELPRGDWLPPRMESAQALATLSGMGRSGVVNAIRVIVHLPRGAPWDSPEGWNAVRRAGDRLIADVRVSRVRSLPVATGLTAPNLQVIAMLPASVRQALGSSDGRLALIEVMPHEEAARRGATDLVRELRTAPAESYTGLAGTALEVGGLPAFNVDYESAIGNRFWGVVAVVIGITTLALMVGFRSLLVAIKAVALNLVSVAAAFGAVVLVFQDGHGISLLGLASPLDGTFAAIPIIVFCVVFGLSMDYEVFLVARVAEARRAGASDDEAIADGLARTGGMITSAAAIMIVVFAAFTLGDFVIVKILGFALATAVFVDATLMRIAIGPALLKLAGRWNWWPGERVSASIAVGSATYHPAPNVTHPRESWCG